MQNNIPRLTTEGLKLLMLPQALYYWASQPQPQESFKKVIKGPLSELSQEVKRAIQFPLALQNAYNPTDMAKALEQTAQIQNWGELVQPRSNESFQVLAERMGMKQEAEMGDESTNIPSQQLSGGLSSATVVNGTKLWKKAPYGRGLTGKGRTLIAGSGQITGGMQSALVNALRAAGTKGSAQAIDFIQNNTRVPKLQRNPINWDTRLTPAPSEETPYNAFSTAQKMLVAGLGGEFKAKFDGSGQAMLQALSGVKGHKDGQWYALQKRGFRKALVPSVRSAEDKRRQLGYNLLSAYNKFIVAYERYQRWIAGSDADHSAYFKSANRAAQTRAATKPYYTIKDLITKQPGAQNPGEAIDLQVQKITTNFAQRSAQQARAKGLLLGLKLAGE